MLGCYCFGLSSVQLKFYLNIDDLYQIYVTHDLE